MKATPFRRLAQLSWAVPVAWAVSFGCSKSEAPGAAETAEVAAEQSAGVVTSAPKVSVDPVLPQRPREPAEPLRLGYSDWPGWVAWDIAREKGWFAEVGVEVQLEWFEYVPSIEAFAAGKLDAVSMTNGDALMAQSDGVKSVAILANDYSNGNDMLIARAGIDDVKSLVGKRVGVEVGFAGHLLLMNALSSAQLSDRDVQIVNVPSDLTPQSLEKGTVDAIATWQPNSGQALQRVSGAKAIYTSRQAAGLIYHLLCVAPASLQQRREDWRKVAEVWMRIADFVNDPRTRNEAARIMAERVGLPVKEYAHLMSGTTYLGLVDNGRHFSAGETLASVQHSNEVVDAFLVEHGMYETPVASNALLDRSLLDDLLKRARRVPPRAPTAP